VAGNYLNREKDRRRSDRIHLSIKGTLAVNDQLHHEFFTDNVSHHGMMINVSDIADNFVSGSFSKKKCKIYFNHENGDYSLSVLSRICWIKGKPQENSCKIGIRYLNLNRQQRQSISSLISKEVVNSYPVAVRKYIPPYILCPRTDSPGNYAALVGQGLLLLARAYSMRQKAYLKKDASLSRSMVKDLYDKESQTYLSRHARTTHRKDDSWRMWLAQTILSKVKEVNSELNRPAQHIDLFSGTGLSYQSQVKVFSMYNAYVNSLLVDYSEGMLEIAENVTLPAMEKCGYVRVLHRGLIESDKALLRNSGLCTVELARGDATCLTGNDKESGFIKVDRNRFDVASIMFGLGAVSLTAALSVSVELLKILVRGGYLRLPICIVPLPNWRGDGAGRFPSSSDGHGLKE
jgi:hypothetical protein